MAKGAKKKSQKTLAAERLQRLGKHLRDAALHADVRWKAVPEFGLDAWVAIAAEAMKRGWRPPLEEPS